MLIPQVMGSVHLHVRTCRCSPVFLILGMAGRVALKFGVLLDKLAMRFTLLGGGVHLHVRTHFPHLGNNWTDCFEFWYVV